MFTMLKDRTKMRWVRHWKCHSACEQQARLRWHSTTIHTHTREQPRETGVPILRQSNSSRIVWFLQQFLLGATHIASKHNRACFTTCSYWDRCSTWTIREWNIELWHRRTITCLCSLPVYQSNRTPTEKSRQWNASAINSIDVVHSFCMLWQFTRLFHLRNGSFIQWIKNSSWLAIRFFSRHRYNRRESRAPVK